MKRGWCWDKTSLGGSQDTTAGDHTRLRVRSVEVEKGESFLAQRAWIRVQRVRKWKDGRKMEESGERVKERVPGDGPWVSYWGGGLWGLAEPSLLRTIVASIFLKVFRHSW
jgi:hypothetical protein